MSNKFIKQTIKGLEGISAEDPLLASRTFDIDKTNNKEDCILIMGLNPAGDKDTADAEKSDVDDHNTYFYSLENTGAANKESKNSIFYNQYFSPIYSFANEVLNNKAKWPWANKTWDEIKKEINRRPEINEKIEHAIKKAHEKQEGRDCTIYIGDMFYYHVTRSKDLQRIKSEDKLRKYCSEMLMLHIDYLENKKIKFIYINNANVSRWLRKKENDTHEFIDGIPMFYGGMLSGQHSMDAASKSRLIKEIKVLLQEGVNK